MKTALSVLQLHSNYFLTSFFKARSIHISRETKDRNAPVVTAFTPVSLLVYGVDHPSLKIFSYPSGTPGHVTHRRQPKNFFLQYLDISGRISSQAAAFPVFTAWASMINVTAVTAFSFPKCNSFMSGVVIVTEFSRYLKYSLHLSRMSFFGLALE